MTRSTTGRKFTTLFLALALVFILISPSSKALEEVIAAKTSTHEPFYVGSTALIYMSYQTFKFNRSVSITGFKMDMGGHTAEAGTFFIATLKGNQWNGPNLTSMSKVRSQVNDSGFNYFTFPTPYTIDANLPYMIHFKAEGTGINKYYTFDSNATNPYPNGFVGFTSDAGASWTNYSDNHDLTMTIFYEEVGIADLPPKVAFIDQHPANLVTNQLFGNTLNISYDITDSTDATGLNYSKIYLNHSLLNSAGTSFNGYLNGTAISGYHTRNYTYEGLGVFNFTLSDNDVYSGLYNYNETVMESTTHQWYIQNLTTSYYLFEIQNFTPSNPLNIIELMFKKSTPPLSYEIGLCNANNVLNPQGSANCTPIQVGNTVNVNHSHQSGNSNHSTWTVSGTAANTINGLFLRQNAWLYFIAKGQVSNGYQLGFIPNPARTNAYKVRNAAGTAYTNIPYAIDFHVHQNNTVLSYQACAYDIMPNDLKNCSDLRSVDVRLGYALSPNTPVFINPNSSIVFNNSLNNQTYINWQTPVSPEGNIMSSYNLSWHYENGTYGGYITGSDLFDTSFVWDNGGVNMTDIQFNLTVCDDHGLCSSGDSVVISLAYYDIASVPTVSCCPAALVLQAETNSLLVSQTNAINLLYEAIKMLGYFIFSCLLLYLGMRFMSETMLIFGSAITGLIGFYTIQAANNDLVMTGFGLVMIVASAMMLINVFIFDRNTRKLGN